MFRVDRIEKEKWIEALAKTAHLSVFGKDESINEHGLDYALIVAYKDSPVIYSTVKNAAVGTVVLEYGGSFPDFRGSSISYLAYVTMLKYLEKEHSDVFMIIRNDNFPMLKFALKSKFKVTGISFNQKGGPLLEHRLTFEKGE